MNPEVKVQREPRTPQTPRLEEEGVPISPGSPTKEMIDRRPIANFKIPQEYEPHVLNRGIFIRQAFEANQEKINIVHPTILNEYHWKLINELMQDQYERMMETKLYQLAKSSMEEAQYYTRVGKFFYIPSCPTS